MAFTTGTGINGDEIHVMDADGSSTEPDQSPGTRDHGPMAAAQPGAVVRRPAHPADSPALRPSGSRRVAVGGATDPDGDPVTLEITGVTQDEPVTGQLTEPRPTDYTGVLLPELGLRAHRPRRDPAPDDPGLPVPLAGALRLDRRSRRRHVRAEHRRRSGDARFGDRGQARALGSRPGEGVRAVAHLSSAAMLLAADTLSARCT